MPTTPTTPAMLGLPQASDLARGGSPSVLADLLCAARNDTLALFGAISQALPALEVPFHPALNPPRWELGHVGWFQTRWVERLQDRDLGHRADPTRPPHPAWPMYRAAAGAVADELDADAMFDSTRVAHAARWALPLPDVPALKRELERGLASTLALLGKAEPTDAGLYVFRLVLLHEDMHHEAGLYMAQALGLPLGETLARRWCPAARPDPGAGLAVPAGVWHSTAPDEADAPGFAFDNELGHAAVRVAPFEIDAQALRWAEFLPFVEAGGYAQSRWWTPEGWRWRLAARMPGHEAAPRYLRRQGPIWEVNRGGQWRALDLRETACHLSAHEAQAWCAWAGRRLPTEFEWSRAQSSHPKAFSWGQVWEWTASPFSPFPGFEPHPYREYSAPWFDGRPVLKGASFMTQPRMRHPRYRNFFTPDRDDLAAGFRTCAC